MALVQNNIKLVKGGTIGGTNKSTGATISATEAYDSWGSSSDLWGDTFSYSDINDSTFGVAISAASNNLGTTSHYLKCTNFGFSLASTATVTGVIAECKWKTTGTGASAVVNVNHVRITVHYSTVADGAGSATGEATVIGVGSSIDNVVFSASGDSTAAGIGAGIVNSIASASGDSTVAGIGAGIANSTASASGDSTASGVGAGVANSVGSAPGEATLSAYGQGSQIGTGTAIGDSTASGVGQSTANSSTSSAGIATAAATGAGVARSTASATGTATATGVGEEINASSGVGDAEGLSTASGTSSVRYNVIGRIKTSTPLKQACSATARMSKLAALSMMPSDLDKSKIVVLETGKVIPNRGYSEEQVRANIQNGTWTYYEKLLPRRMFITNPNWTVSSFDPRTRSVCIQIHSSSGSRLFSFIAPAGVGLQYGNPRP